VRFGGFAREGGSMKITLSFVALSGPPLASAERLVRIAT
jgi:hypothetical protein